MSRLRGVFLGLSLWALLSACMAGAPVDPAGIASIPVQDAHSPQTPSASPSVIVRSVTPVALSTPTMLPSSPTPFPPTPTPCVADQCVYNTSLLLARPIAPPGNDIVDSTYRFGSTQGKNRDPHHGVEFLNGFGTPVLAAGDGVVVVAGDDRQTLYSPYLNYYGNLVVIQHDQLPAALQGLPVFPTPMYSLYAHLSAVLVKAGQVVRLGQQIGRVGMTGGATGSHLHFEVRLGENTYAAARNPELWLQTHTDASGQPNGALAVRLLDAKGRPIAVSGVVVQHLPDGPGQPAGAEIYLSSYEEKGLLGQPPYGESFAAGDLPAGWYLISFPYGGVQKKEVQVFPGQVTVVTFQF